MSITLTSLVSPLLFSILDYSEPMNFASIFIFEPPKCEHQVVFPHYPQKVGVLKYDESVYSAQLHMENSFLRADCSVISLPEDADRNALLKAMLTNQITQIGGERMMILEYEINDVEARYTGQVVLESTSVMVSGAFYLGESSVMMLTAIDKHSAQSSPESSRFLASATHF
ncbi:MAG: hypothetical protein MI864_11440 [Pseudomonadales bacterium]|uniref:Uncharacterized protein n=1 Tax=Oleiphilus messinensis TaxID=141451 RepID=A0A1Y0I908_9GAMM|nr:hypothetical protein [Oleiphilus messinensis]ARU56988.1 hypothetical protein OLMES_2944 [Oleiphilus messinensis]MCG8611140.1 hypothetical protein [Pseudomonadales bacterium]